MSIEETYFSIKTMCLSAQLTDSAVKRWNISSKIRNRIRMVTFALLFNTILKILVTAIRESSKKNLNWKSCLIHLKVKVTQSFPTLCDPMDHGILWARIQGFPHSSVGKEYACIAGEPGLIPGLGRSAGEGIGYPLQFSWASLMAQLVKKSACNAVHLGLIPGLGRSPGEGYSLQYSGLENSMDCTVHGVRHDWATFTFTSNWKLNCHCFQVKWYYTQKIPNDY